MYSSLSVGKLNRGGTTVRLSDVVKWISSHARHSASIRTQIRIFKDRELSALPVVTLNTANREIWGKVGLESESSIVNPFSAAPCAELDCIVTEVRRFIFPRITFLSPSNFCSRYLLGTCAKSCCYKLKWNLYYEFIIIKRKKSREGWRGRKRERERNNTRVCEIKHFQKRRFATL